MHQHHRAGEKVFVDCFGQTEPVFVPDTGAIHQAAVFMAILGASNYTYVEMLAGQNLESWIAAHVNAFASFGGVPEVVIPARPRKPQDKAKVESAVGVVSHWVLAPLRDWRFSAWRRGMCCRYYRVPWLLSELPMARGDGSYPKKLARLAKAQLLILDN